MTDYIAFMHRVYRAREARMLEAAAPCDDISIRRWLLALDQREWDQRRTHPQPFSAPE